MPAIGCLQDSLRFASQVVQGDLRDPAQVGGLFANVQAIVCATGTTAFPSDRCVELQCHLHHHHHRHLHYTHHLPFLGVILLLFKIRYLMDFENVSAELQGRN